MMETRNVTLALPSDLLHEVKLLAVGRRTSISALMRESLERLVRDEDAYVRARERQLEWLERGFDLGTDGQAPATRDELNARELHAGP